MNTIIIDDEPWMVRHFCDESADLEEINLISSFRNPLKALEFAESNAVELAFIDMEMPQLNGVETAKKLSEILPDVKIIIISAYDEGYIRKMGACDSYGYLRKPYQSDDLCCAIKKMFAKNDSVSQ